MYYELTYSPNDNRIYFGSGNQKHSLNTQMIYLFLLYLIILALGCNKLFRNKKDSDENIIADEIGGWVILPIIGLALSPFIALFHIFKTFFIYQISESLPSGYSALVSFELFSQSFFVVVPVMLFIMAIKKDRRFPYFMILYYVINILFQIIDIAWASAYTNIVGALTYSDLYKSMIYALIWIPFFTKSTRCKDIFVK